MNLLLLALIALQAPADGAKPKQGPIDIHLQSDTIGVLGIPLAESRQPIFRISIKGKVQPNGEGKAILSLEPAQPPDLDDFGFPATPIFLEAINLDGTFGRLKPAGELKAGERIQTWNGKKKVAPSCKR